MASKSPSKHALSLLDNIASLSAKFKDGTEGSREGLLDACTSLITELRNPSENMLRLLWAQPTHLNVLWMSVEVGLFHALAASSSTAATVAELAAKCEKRIDPTLLGRMLRHLAAMGTVRETGPGTFASTPTSIAFAERAYEDSILYIADNFQPVLQTVPSYFKQRDFKLPDSGTDGPFQQTFDCKGSHYFEYFANEDPEMGRRFASMMESWSKGRPRWFDEGYYPVRDRLINSAKPERPFLVDIGGGSGHDVEALREAFQGQIPGPLILQDRPEIVELAQVREGVEAVAHDFLTEQPVKGARAYYLHSIIQDWSDEVNISILEAIVPAMEPRYSKILVNDFVVPNQGAHWAQTCLDWELMASLGARHRTEDEHRRMYQAAGLKITGIWTHKHGLDSLIELELS